MDDVSKMTATERYESVRSEHSNRQKAGTTPHDVRFKERADAEWLAKEKEAKDKSNG